MIDKIDVMKECLSLCMNDLNDIIDEICLESSIHGYKYSFYLHRMEQTSLLSTPSVETFKDGLNAMPLYHYLSTNIQSIRAKCSELKIFVETLQEIDFSFSAIQESWFSVNEDTSQLQLNGY